MANAESRKVRVILVITAGVMALVVAAVAPPHNGDGRKDLVALGLDHLPSHIKTQGIMKP